MRFQIKNRETVSFKKRYQLGYSKLGLLFGDFAFILGKSFNIEFIYLYNFKKSLKKYFYFKKSKYKKVWLFLHKNYPLTKKSKNARMGKGKGTLSRYCARVLQNHNLFEFSGFNIKELLVLKKIFNKKVPIPVTIFCSFFSKKNYKTTSGTEAFFFFKKYSN